MPSRVDKVALENMIAKQLINVEGVAWCERGKPGGNLHQAR